MKKTFPATATGKDDARVRDKIRHEVNKYVKRERRKPLPEGAEQWDFLCRLGVAEASAESVALKDIAAGIETLGTGGAAQIFVEVLSVPGKRKHAKTADET